MRVGHGTGAIVALTVLLLGVGAPPAGAEPLRCQRAITRASAKFFQAVTKATQTCESTVIEAGTGSCPDAKMTGAISTASLQLTAAIARACGGSDLVCNADAIDEDLPSAIGWPDVCPSLATTHCDAPITSCAGVASCVACLATAAAGAARDLVYDSMLVPSTGNQTLNRCQRAVGKANAAYAAAVSRALEGCWQKRMTGHHANPCAPPALGDGKYLGAIAKAGAKHAALIGKACGGPDRALGGGDDLSPAAIGFPDTCPAAVVPGGPTCDGAILDLEGMVGCLSCVTDAAVTCVDRGRVPQLAPYPAECAQCLSPPLGGPCPTTLALTADGERVDLDLGFTGGGHDARMPSNGGVTVAVSGCAGTEHPTCGACTIAGPIHDAGGPSAVSRRCRDDTWETCTTDADCSGGDACTTFFGPPQGIVVFGFSSCVLNEITGPVTGTLNLTDGTAAMQLGLRTRTYFVGTPGQSCPACVAGVCDSGPRAGEACTAQGGGAHGDDVTLDCPPNPGALLGTLTLPFALSTEEQARELTAASPTCRQTGFTSLKCHCDSCNNANHEACTANADCPASGGGPGICGGRRCIGGVDDGKPCSQCIGGPNHGANCSTDSACPGGSCPTGCPGTCTGGSNAGAVCSTVSECPGGTCPLGQCNRAGEPTQTNSCADDPDLPGWQGECVATSNGEGQCLLGPTDTVCSVDTFVACTADADCRASNGCTACSTDEQTCTMRMRECFTDNGLVGNPVIAAGKPGPPCGARAEPTLAAFTCVAPITANAGNAGVGLPGLGRIRLPLSFTP